MNFFCTSEFKDQYDRLLKKKSYKSIEQSLFEYLYNRKVEDFKSGVNINNNQNCPFIKKRIEGSSGFRLYYLLIIVKENLYLAYLYPKTGSLGIENINADKRNEILKNTYIAIEKRSLFKIDFDEKNRTCLFN